jgi:hypothetical protein
MTLFPRLSAPLATCATACALLLMANAGQAATVTFDLTGNDSGGYNSLPSSFSLTQDGLTATFDAKSFTTLYRVGNTITNGSVVLDGHIGRFSPGAGVYNSPGDNSHTVDGSGYKDFIQVTLSAAVQITGVSFGYYDNYDHFRWMMDTSGDGQLGVGDFVSDRYKISQNNPFSAFGGAMGSVFGFLAAENDDSWKLRTVTFEYTPPSQVPLPAAGILLVGALGGLGLIGRRRKAA